MVVDNVKVYGLEESIKASKYPMSVDISKCNGDITSTAKKLGSSEKGEGHDQFLTGITVQFDLTCSNKMWVEAERYRFLYFVSSQSTMHRICKFNLDTAYIKYVDPRIVDIMKEKVADYNELQEHSKYWTINSMTQAEVDSAKESLKNKYLETIYSQRKTHKLPEWREFTKWIETLPMFKELCLGGEADG